MGVLNYHLNSPHIRKGLQEIAISSVLFPQDVSVDCPSLNPTKKSVITTRNACKTIEAKDE